MDPNRPETNNYIEAFETFFHGWLTRQEHFLTQLLESLDHQNGNEEEKEVRRVDLIARVISHYSQYYEEKSRVAHRDVFLLFSPTWFTSFERSFLWVAGFKPGLAFRLVNSSVLDLTEEQNTMMEVLVEEIRAEERELAVEMERVQEDVAAAVVVVRPPVNGERDGVESRVRSTMEMVVECGDYLRGKTVLKVMDILSSAQSVEFLAASFLGIAERDTLRFVVPISESLSLSL